MSTHSTSQLSLPALDDEIATLVGRAQVGQPELLTILGQPGAGKSTLAREIAEHHDGVLVAADSFLYDSYRRRGDSLYDKYDDVSQMLALRTLFDAQPFGYEPFDVRDRKRQGWSVLEPKPLIVLEGVIPLHSPYVRLLSALTIFVDARTEVREAREMQRVIEDGWYKGASIDERRQKILDKRVTEAPIIAEQLALCRWLVDTTSQPAKVERLHQVDESGITLM